MKRKTEVELTVSKKVKIDSNFKAFDGFVGYSSRIPFYHKDENYGTKQIYFFTSEKDARKQFASIHEATLVISPKSFKGKS